MVFSTKTFKTTSAESDSLLSSTAVAKQLGVTVSTVKRWADDGTLTCVRTAGGHRRFSLQEVQRHANQGAPIQNEWIDLLKSNRGLHAVQAALLNLRDSEGSWCQAAQALGTVIQEMGRRWTTGEMAIYEEHHASERLQRGLAYCADSIPTANTAPVCLLVVPEGEEHTLGLSLLEPCVKELGLRTQWIGRRTPIDQILACIDANSDLGIVAMSASSCGHKESNLLALANRVGMACKESGARLWLGGTGPWPDSTQYGRRLHAFTDLQGLQPQNNLGR